MLSPDHLPVLTDSLRSPSAHNAQPWRLVENVDCYELHYDHTDYLPFDPDDRDAYLCLGAFVETLSLAAMRYGQRADFEPLFTRADHDFFVGRIRLRPAADSGSVDPLAAAAADRHTNRCEYDDSPLPEALRDALSGLGCVLVAPEAMSRLVAKASVCAWKDRRFVRDLRAWIRLDPAATSGMTPAGLPLTRVETAGLRFALRVGRLPTPLARAFASRDVRLLKRASSVAVVRADDLTPTSLFDAGRRLLRAWVSINAAGLAYHPISIAVDRPETAPAVAQISGVGCPVAVFRIGRPTKVGPRSNRRPLAEVLVESVAVAPAGGRT
jgi:hypothetical protein